MAPSRTRHQHTSSSSDEGIPAFPAPPGPKTTGTEQEMRTPERTSARPTSSITQMQKQALVDNLQLEVTERARKLRAQYNLQAQSLRSRLEMRVNRIPQALRRRNMQELMEEHLERSKPASPPPVSVAPKTYASNPAEPPQYARQSAKRKSDEISTDNDKENVPAPPQEPLGNPKKRAKNTIMAANTKVTRTTSRNKVGPGGVLSPKSHNSRTLQRSPFKSAQMPSAKPPVGRLAAAKENARQAKPASRAPSRQVKRTAATGPESDGRGSEASTSSAGTTIVTKPGAKKATVPRKAVPAKPAPAASTVGRKAAAVSKKEAPAPATRVGSGRILRKRG